MKQGIYIKLQTRILLIYIMSVDVFGRNLKKSEGGRGPPGIGFKITTDGNYDMENRRISNLASPIQSNEAVNLSTLHQEIDKVLEITARLKSDQNDLDDKVENYRDDIDIKLRQLDDEIRTIKDIVLIYHDIQTTTVQQ